MLRLREALFWRSVNLTGNQTMKKATRADGLVQRFGRGGGTRTRTGDAHVLLRHARLPFRHAPMAPGRGIEPR